MNPEITAVFPFIVDSPLEIVSLRMICNIPGLPSIKNIDEM